MDEAERYQQRLRVIAERRRQQEEDEKLRRETEKERLKTAQEKRKHLREQWLSGTAAAPVPVLPSFDTSRPRPPLQDEADEHTAAEQTKSQKTPEDEDEEAADARKEKQTSEDKNKESVNCAAAARTHSHCQTGTDEDVQVNKEAEDYFSTQMAQRMFHESRQDGRSVLGSVAVQVERDHRTGATIIRSVSPVSSPADTPMATTVFDDGRKSIHAVGGAGDQPSTEEIGQILDVIEGVGMKVLLDEVTVDTKKEETKVENVDADSPPQGETLSLPASHAMPEEDNIHLDSSTSYNFEAELGIEDGAEGMENKEDKEEDRSVMVVKDIVEEVYKVEDQPSNEGPVSLVFLGYTESTTDQSYDQDNDEGMLTVERVMITEEGEEHVIEPETSVSPEAEKESEDQVFQDVPLEGNGAAVDKVEVEEDDKGLHSSSLPSIADAGGESKRKTCQCCSVM